jgi:hypothetical protein
MNIEKYCRKCEAVTPRYKNRACRPCKNARNARYQKATGHKHTKLWKERNPLRVAEHQLRAAQNRLERLKQSGASDGQP